MEINQLPLLSVIIPVYNVERYIERCARSLFSQKLENIEFIFVDDCSPDNSINVLKRVVEEFQSKCAQMHWDVRIEKMPRNSGQAAVREHGIHVSQGLYITHCDSDDWVNENIYLKMLTVAKESDADMVVCDYFRTDGEKHYTPVVGASNISLCRGRYLIDVLYQKFPWALWNKIVKKDIINKAQFYPSCNLGEDMVLVAQYIALSNKISYINSPLYYYYTNAGSIMNVTGEEKAENKYNQLKENTKILVSAMGNFLTNKELKIISPSLRFNMILPILPYVKIKKFRDIFKKEINEVFPYLFNFNIFWRYRVLFILIKMNLYPLR